MAIVANSAAAGKLRAAVSGAFRKIVCTFGYAKCENPRYCLGFSWQSTRIWIKMHPTLLLGAFQVRLKNPLQQNSLHYGIIYTRIHIRFVLVKPLCGIFRLIGEKALLEGDM